VKTRYDLVMEEIRERREREGHHSFEYHRYADRLRLRLARERPSHNATISTHEFNAVKREAQAWLEKQGATRGSHFADATVTWHPPGSDGKFRITMNPYGANIKIDHTTSRWHHEKARDSDPPWMQVTVGENLKRTNEIKGRHDYQQSETKNRGEYDVYCFEEKLEEERKAAEAREGPPEFLLRAARRK